jgi:hypothetical protein
VICGSCRNGGDALRPLSDDGLTFESLTPEDVRLARTWHEKCSALATCPCQHRVPDAEVASQPG